MTTTAENGGTFCRMVEARSREHRDALRVALDNGWLAIAGSVLRMEVDSMIRLIWILRHPDTREQILASCVAGGGFRAGPRRISDREMAAEAGREEGWVQAVYRFGNTFVHLTNAHDYAVLDPFQAYEDRGEVIEFLNRYHRGKVPGGPVDDSSSLGDIAAYAPHVLEKITANLDEYASALREECAKG
ncbi:hypothetical protein EAS64_10475 [Trebonia kvetii]|uniref:Uncharacterized protein n=1 Tax=Trebonia kvetii TaxID=2480626 RepID=A0A6P2C248_9ACTN|nr:hypothetical protein [Trebonia kvetii]TVZ05037.1 hypothetical protein EAS64_10475 [Trebonia kvetii]